MNQPESISTGQWGESVSWELLRNTELPDLDKCTAAFCLAVTDDDRIVLMQATRGWGMLGGHKEAIDTTIQATAAREANEEGGFNPSQLHSFAYRKITSTERVSRPDGDGYYPFPDSYIVYFWAKTLDPITEPSGEEVIASRSFSIDELRSAGEAQIPDLPIIEAGWQAYLDSRYP